MEVNEQAFANGFSAGYAAGGRVEKIKAKERMEDCIMLPKTMRVVVDGDIPTRAHEDDAGLDLYSTKDGWIFPKSYKVFSTGIHAEIPKGFVGMLTSKSGLMLKGITSRGTIDSGYTGTIRAVLFNHGWLPRRIRKGQKITQLVIMPIATPGLEFVKSLDETERSTGGFGSTGKY